MSKPRTPAQIEASRRNGALSKGPVTRDGKARSAQNARKHGLYATTGPVLFSERSLRAYTKKLESVYKPVGEAELAAFHHLVEIRAQLRAFEAYEARALNRARTDNDSAKALAFSVRHAAGLRQRLIAALAALDRLQNQRRSAEMRETTARTQAPPAQLTEKTAA